jgi:SAM-dependent methyltransferase
VGMLPPKLAQIIINLALGPNARHPGAGRDPVNSEMTSDLATTQNDIALKSSSDTVARASSSMGPGLRRDDAQALTILDPFCGTGVILQEALLMGYDVYGTDLAEKMIDYSEENLRWLKMKAPYVDGTVFLEVADAMTHQWKPDSFTTVAGETYLGQPFSALPKPEKLQEVIDNADHIHTKFLKNLAEQIPSGMRLCLAVPAWNMSNGTFKHLPVLDRLEKLGYTRIDLKHARRSELIYHREDQIVGRELLILVKK